MKYLRNQDVAELLTLDLAAEAMERAFRALARGDAAVQTRVRTVTAVGKLSSVGAVLAAEGLAGAKVYPTSAAGRFGFVILLFDVSDARPLAVMEGAALTQIRTAATSVVAARHLARPNASVLTLFGTGAQATAHVRAFAEAFQLDEIRVVHRREAPDFVERVSELTGVPTRQMVDPAEALGGAEVVITATRAAAPVLYGADLSPGVHVTAVGATQPTVHELDETAVQRADVVVVESVPQARQEAGDLVLAEAAGAFSWDRAVELSDLLAGRAAGRTASDQISLFDSIGIGLEDVAAAAAVYTRAVEVGAGIDLPSDG